MNIFENNMGFNCTCQLVLVNNFNCGLLFPFPSASPTAHHSHPHYTETLSHHRPRSRMLGREAEWRLIWRYGGGPWCPERRSRRTENQQTSLSKPQLCGWRVEVKKTGTSCNSGMACSFPLNTLDSRTSCCVPADSSLCLHPWRYCCRQPQCLRHRSTPLPNKLSPAVPPCTRPEGSTRTDPGVENVDFPTTLGSPSCCYWSTGALSWQCWDQRSSSKQLSEVDETKLENRALIKTEKLHCFIFLNCSILFI